jgi:iron only hydrogenase large subunit-like protein
MSKLINPIKTLQENCVGCHKCKRICPVKANLETIHFKDVATIETSTYIDDDRCIQCGACIEACHHMARYYEDDLEIFLADLKSKNNRMAVIAAPAFLYNFKDYKRVMGWLKSLGVETIQDVSFGADITTYVYLKLYDSLAKSYIAQPCPVIVNYIEMYAPHLIPNLAPRHSPAMCSAI